MMKIEDTSIPRFKLVSISQKERYVVDLDSHKIAWLFPMFTWYLANRAMRIDERQYTKLKSVQKNKTGASLWSFTGFALGGAIYGLLKGLEGIILEEITFTLLLSVLVLIVPLVFMLRYIRSKVNYKGFKKIVNSVEEIEFCDLVKLKQDNPFYRKRCLQATLMFIGGLVFLIILYFQARTLVLIPIIFLYLLFMSFINTSILKPFKNMEYTFNQA